MEDGPGRKRGLRRSQRGVKGYHAWWLLGESFRRKASCEIKGKTLNSKCNYHFRRNGTSKSGKKGKILYPCGTIKAQYRSGGIILSFSKEFKIRLRGARRGGKGI